jgi:hypothetical protein
MVNMALAQEEMLNIALSPSALDELIQFLTFLLPLGCLIFESFKRCTPCYHRERASIRASRAAARESRNSANSHEDIDVDVEQPPTPAPAPSNAVSKEKMAKQRQKDKAEEAAIKAGGTKKGQGR